MSKTFQEWLAERGVDCQSLTKELAAALVKQWQDEQPEPVRSLILIPDDTPEERWSRAIRLEVASCN